MKILLIGNYAPARQQSMQRFAELMRGMLSDAGHDVRLLRPPAVFGRLCADETGIGKWLGYIDRYILFFPFLWIKSRWAEVVHICDHSNAMYVSALGSRPNLVTCHDLLAIRSALGQIKRNYTRWSGRVQQRWVIHGLERTRHIACDSTQTRTELLDAVIIPAQRVSILHTALNYPYRPMSTARARVQVMIPLQSAPYLLHVGGNQWYKNRAGVLRMFKVLSLQPEFIRHHLVMVGKPLPTELRSAIDQLDMAGRVHECINVSNEDLHAFYCAADALLFLSLHEGFGWPIIEAQACGCPVITSNRAPMTEVGGEGAIYVDPEDAATVIRAAIDMLARRDELIRMGIKNVSRFPVERMRDGYLDIYRQLVREPPSDTRGKTSVDARYL